MSEAPPCPDLQHLLEFVLGKAPSSEVQRLGQHLLTCSNCIGTLCGLSAEDTLIQQLETQRASATSPVKELLDSVIQRLREPSASVPGEGSTIPTAIFNPGSAANTARRAKETIEINSRVAEVGRVGGYQILKVIGSGGMGLVLQAEDINLQRKVALKVMLPEVARNADAKQRFLREARAVAAIKHEHIVTVYQVGQERDIPFLAMEYLEGESLETRLVRENKLPISQVLRIGREIAEGLAAAHASNLIHRDIKPANIWLEASSGRVKILDFGLARPADGKVHLTGIGTVMGTPQYMAPEQARGEAVNGASKP